MMIKRGVFICGVWFFLGCEPLRVSYVGPAEISEYDAKMLAIIEKVKVDPDDLVIRHVSLTNHPRPHKDFYDLIVEISAHPKTQMFEVSLCSKSQDPDKEPSCRHKEPLSNRVKISTADLPSQHISVKIKACVPELFSKAPPKTCGPEYQTDHTLPDNSQDHVLQSYVNELDRLRDSLAEWDDQVVATLERYQKNIDQCFDQRKDAQAADEQKVWAMLAGALLMSPLNPSEQSVPDLDEESPDDEILPALQKDIEELLD
ncbi:MAG: hypothetical protein OXC40_05075, partial [Proteobacteria bacterium]|nr:hypothetical protein [Pseudomonadota bacterium]